MALPQIFLDLGVRVSRIVFAALPYNLLRVCMIRFTEKFVGVYECVSSNSFGTQVASARVYGRSTFSARVYGRLSISSGTIDEK